MFHKVYNLALTPGPPTQGPFQTDKTNQIDQINQTDQINQINEIDRKDQLSRVKGRPHSLSGGHTQVVSEPTSPSFRC